MLRVTGALDGGRPLPAAARSDEAMDAAEPPSPDSADDAPLRYVDTETAGGRAGPQSLIEVAVIGGDGAVLIDTLVDPGRPIDPFTMRIHGISDEMVEGAPTWDEVAPAVA